MRPAARFAVAAILALTGLVVPASAQTQSTNTKHRGSTISGRVTIKDKAAPGVVVGLQRTDMNPYETLPRATTDDDGKYRITNISPGSYQVITRTPAYVPSDPNNFFKSVVIGEDENLEDINFALVRGGVITGKVTDADGRPVIQQQVILYSAESFNEKRNPGQPARASGAGVTDDRGIYRMFGLAAGRYKVAAGQGDESPYGGGGGMPGRTSYKQVFHPDVSDQAKADVVEVSEGSEATDVDITLGKPLQTFSVSGRLIESERGQPVPNMRFGLQKVRGDRFDFINVFPVSNSRGEFRIENLGPGKYTVMQTQMGAEPQSDLRVESVSFDVIDQDVNGVIIKVSKGGSISGAVIVETEDKTAIAKVSQLQLYTQVISEGQRTLNFGRSSPIGPDGTFYLGGLQAGTANFSINSMDVNLMKGFVISRIERDGVVPPNGIVVGEGEQVSGVRIVLSYGTATLRGVVNVENGTIPPIGGIYIRLQKPGDTNPIARSVRVDSRGHFMVDGVPGGVYDLIVNVYLPNQQLSRPVKQQVNLQDGAVTDVSVTVDLEANSQPKSPERP